MRRAAFIYQEQLSRHVLREDHVLQPTRLQLTFELLQLYHAFDNAASKLALPRPATDAELLTFHTREYVEAVKSFSRGERLQEQERFNFSDSGDNPVYEGIYEASALAAGASLVAADLLATGQAHVAFNVSGGMHHAAPGYASGFCVFNDPALAIHYFLKKGLRVAYVDIDAHHGDGVQKAFYNRKEVLTISLHETGMYLFPGTGDVTEIGTGEGLGYAVNLPLSPFTEDDTYLWAFDQVVPPLVKAFKPDVLVTQLGCDTHYLDPLTHIALTTQGYTEVVRRLGQLAPGPGRWLALGGGGYEMGVVACCWALAYGLMAGRDWPDAIPAEFQERYGLKRLHDQERPKIEAAWKERSRRFAESSVEAVKRLVFPHHDP